MARKRRFETDEDTEEEEEEGGKSIDILASRLATIHLSILCIC